MSRGPQRSNTLLLEGLPDELDNVRPKLELYFRNKRRSGGEVLEINADPRDTRRAILVYVDETAFNRVMSKRKHSIDFRAPHGVVELQVKAQADDQQQEGPAEKKIKPLCPDQEDKLEVCQPDQATDVDGGAASYHLLVTSDQDKYLLQLYFEHFAAEPTLTKHGQCTWILQLSNKTDMDRVCAKKVHDHGISVVIYDESRLDRSRFVLSGFDDNCMCSHVSLYIGSCSQGAEHVWETIDGDRIVVTFKQDININEFMRKCSSKKFQDKEISARRLEVTDSVLVQGDMSSISEEALNLYFSSKRSKGGDITSLCWLTQNESAIITFQDSDVAYRVAERKQHSFCSKQIKTQLFYRSLQIALTGETSLPTNMATNTVVPVSAELIGFIGHNAAQKLAFTSALEKVHSSVSFLTDTEPPRIELGMALQADTLGMLRQSPGWEAKAQREAQEQLNRYTEERLPAEAEVWQGIENGCLALATEKSGVFFQTSTSEVVVVGTRDEVKAVAEKVANMVKKTADELRIKRDTAEREIHLDTKEKLDLIWDLASGKMGTDVVPTKDDESLSIRLKGQRNAVNTAEGTLNKVLEGVDSRKLVMCPHLMSFMKSLDLKKFQKDHFAQNNITAVLIAGEESVQILSNRADFRKAEEKLREVLQNKDIELTGTQDKVIRGESWRQFLEDLKSSQDVHSISIKMSEKKIEVCGFSGVVSDVLSKIKAYLEDNVPVTAEVPLKSPQELEFVRFLRMFSDDPEIKALGVTVSPSKSQAPPCLEVKAASDKIKQATDAVTRLIGTILTEKLMYSKAGEAKILKKNELLLKTKATSVQCCLHLTHAAAATTTQPCVFDIGSVTLTLSQGDISKHTSDALICPLSSLAFDNPIAQQFLQSGGPEIKQVIDKFQKEKQSLTAGDVVLSKPGSLKCKKLIYAVIPVCGKGISSLHATYLANAVNKSLAQAVSNQCASIAMSSLDCVTFGFPVKDCCEAIMMGILNLGSTSQGVLRSVHLIDSDAKVVEELKSTIEGLGFDQTVIPKTPSGVLPPQSAASPSPSQSPIKYPTTRVIGGVSVALKKGDITKEAVDIIVNSTNQQLNLNTGVSGAILKAAGKSVMDECTKHGAQKADGVVLTSGGSLRCKHIAQMVGPTNAPGITASIEKVLQLCDTQMAATVAIPTIGTGRGGISPKDCIEAILEAVEKHTTWTASTSLKTICVVAFEDKIFNAMGDVFCKNKRPKKRVTSQAKAASTNKSVLPQDQVTIRGVKIEVRKGDITQDSVKGIVNTTNADINLTGGVHAAIFKAAGPAIEQECQKIRPLKGDVVGVTSGGNMKCDYVLHMVGPHNAADATTRVRKVLECCEQRAITTLSLPAVGTGGGGMKGVDCVGAILQGVRDHLSSTTSSVLKVISMVIQQDNILQDFLQGLSQWTVDEEDDDDDDDGSDTSSQWDTTSEKDDDTSSQLSTSEDEEDIILQVTPMSSLEAMVGPVKVKVFSDDITREKTDAIVSSTNSSLDLSSGVSGAILKAAGQSVVDECKTLGTQPTDGVVITKPGNLPTKHIIHMVGQTRDTEITSSMRKVLQMCEDHKLQSVSFPALGTGAGNLGALQVGNAMMAAVEEHIKSHQTTTLKAIHFVIFQQKMLQDFEEVMKKFKRVLPKKPVTQKSHRSPPKTSTTAAAKPSSTPSHQDTLLSLSNACSAVSFSSMEVVVMGCSAANLAEVKKAMEDIVSEECHSEELSSSLLPLLLEEEMQAVVDFSQKSQVSVLVSPSNDKATISGKKADVLAAVLLIKDFLDKAKERKSRREDEKRLRETVSWDVASGEVWKTLDLSVSLDLERAMNGQQPSLTYSHKGQQYTVDLKTMQHKDAKGTITRIKRTIKADSETAVIQSPPNWTPMANKVLDIVDLVPASEEYKKVAADFINTSQCPQNGITPKIQVVKIQRIQNTDQWQRYAVRKQGVDRKYPNNINEMTVYHGTNAATCPKINVSGFNRSFCGKNAVVYGEGTYFAKESWYSIQDAYSNPDANGIKYIYRARILVGKPCKGSSGMKEPLPLNPSNLADGLHDSAVDNPQNPFIYVVFCDAGAYPDYLISFKTS